MTYFFLFGWQLSSFSVDPNGQIMDLANHYELHPSWGPITFIVVHYLAIRGHKCLQHNCVTFCWGKGVETVEAAGFLVPKPMETPNLLYWDHSFSLCWNFYSVCLLNKVCLSSLIGKPNIQLRTGTKPFPFSFFGAILMLSGFLISV